MRRDRPEIDSRRLPSSQRSPARFTGVQVSPVNKRVAGEVVERDDLIYGRNAVVEALKSARPINRVLMAIGLKDAASLQVKTLARQVGVVVEEVARTRLDSLTAGNHQGILAIVAAKEYVELDSILEAAGNRKEKPLVLLLDEIEDPRNLGAILRTADAAGVDGVVIPQRRAVGLTESVSKASAGAIEHVPVAREVNLVRVMERLKNEGYWIVGVDMTGDKGCQEADFDVPLALVVGGEDKGIGRLVKEHCDYLVRIPMVGHVPSLNSSVAASIALYEVVRQRSNNH